MEEIWLEKYRPQTLDEVHGNEETVNQLKTIVKQGNIPNMILVVTISIIFNPFKVYRVHQVLVRRAVCSVSRIPFLRNMRKNAQWN